MESLTLYVHIYIYIYIYIYIIIKKKIVYIYYIYTDVNSVDSLCQSEISGIAFRLRALEKLFQFR